MGKRNIALVGIGKIAIDQHVPALNASPDWELSATCSILGSVSGVEHFTEFSALLAKRTDIDVISFCLPPIPRFDFAQEALLAGRHVMLEKPPCATLAECYALEDLARQKGLAIFASWHSRSADFVPAAKAWLRDKHVRQLVVTWKEDVRRWHPGQDWIFAAGGLGIFDPAINAFSILTEILPERIFVKSAELNYPSNRETPISGTIQFQYPGADRADAELDFLKTGEQIWSIHIETDAGTLTLRNGGARMEIDGREEGLDQSKPLNNEYPRLYDHMAQLVDRADVDMDLEPMILVADAFTLGKRNTVDPFNW